MRTPVFLLAILPSLIFNIAHAQSVPGAALPGQIERQFQTPLESRTAPSAPVLPVPKLSLPASADAVSFKLDRVELEGLTLTPSAGFREMLKVEPGRESTLAGSRLKE